MSMNYIYKIAEADWEFDLIYKMNYQTFVDEIPQHNKNLTKQLIDKFHSENKYFICLKNNKLMGMVAVRNQRPFSLDAKLHNLDRYFPANLSMGEIRLLSVSQDRRGSIIATNLFKMVRDWGYEQRHDLVLISGIAQQLPLYKKLGFLPFGPLVGNDNAWFQPMYLTRESFIKIAPAIVRTEETEEGTNRSVNFLPGPVLQERHVSKALSYPAVSHRGLDYRLWVTRIKWHLTNATHSKNVEIFTATGTLANDVVAGQLNQIKKSGLILINGEFGERLTQHADGFDLKYQSIKTENGEPFDLLEIENALIDSNIGWLWVVHLETSSGLVNDIEGLAIITKKNNVKLCIDGISAVGNIKTNYSTVYLATCVSGKGISAFTGLSMVFYNHELEVPTRTIPVYLNLYKYKTVKSPLFSGSSNLIYALYQALDTLDLIKRINNIESTYHRLLNRLAESFLSIKANTGITKVIINLQIPKDVDSSSLGWSMEQKGYLLHYRSEYLIRNNIIQIALMSENSFRYYHEMIEFLEESFLEQAPK